MDDRLDAPDEIFGFIQGSDHCQEKLCRCLRVLERLQMILYREMVVVDINFDNVKVLLR